MLRKLALCLLLSSYLGTISGQTPYQQALEDCLQKAYLESQQCMCGVQVPNFKVTTYAGEHLTADELQGKVMVLHFWMMTCPTCLDQLDGLNQLVTQYQYDSDVVFLSFTTETIPFLEDDFFPNYSLLFKIVPDFRQFLADEFRVPWGFPITMVIDRATKIHSIYSMRDWEGEDWPMEIQNKLGAAINSCLKQ